MKGSAAIAALTSACAALSAGAPRLAPLDSEGELIVEAAAGMPEPDSVAAVRSDGAETPLAKGMRAYASGRLPPGTYRGLLLRTGKNETPVEASFSIERRRAAILQLRADFTAATPPRTLAPLLGLCPSSGEQRVRLFDKHSREITAALPTGRGPWGVALDSLRSRAYVALSGEDAVAEIDLLSGEELGRIRLNAGDEPRELALTPDRRVLLSADYGSGFVSVLDVDAQLEIARIPAGEAPQSLLLDPAGRRAFVFSGRASTVTVIDLPSRAAVTTLALDATPLRGQLDRAGSRLYVASAASPFLSVFSLPDLALKARTYVGLGISALKVDSDTDLLYVAQGSRLAVFDPFSLIPVDYVDVGGAATYAAIDGVENALFLLEPGREAIAVVDLVTRKRLAELDAGSAAHVLALMGERF